MFLFVLMDASSKGRKGRFCLMLGAAIDGNTLLQVTPENRINIPTSLAGSILTPRDSCNCAEPNRLECCLIEVSP